MRGCIAQGAMLRLGATAMIDAGITRKRDTIKVDKVGATVLFERACEGGSRLGCLEHASALLDDGIKIPGAVDGARASFDKACKGANKRGCATLAFSLDAKGSKISASRRLAMAKKGCDQGHLPDCREWTQLDISKAPVTPFERLCRSTPNVLSCTVASALCLRGDDVGSCTTSTIQAIAYLSVIKARLSPNEYAEYRLQRPAILAAAFGVSCTTWKDVRGCALKALVEKIPTFENAGARGLEAGVHPGATGSGKAQQTA